MNRVLILGVAIFLAIVGIALLGTSDQVLAGHGCHGCNGCNGGCNGGYCNGGGCNGGGCHGGYHNGCHGGHGCHGCHGGNGGAYDAPPAEAAPPAPASASRTYQRQQFGFRRINFRR